MCFINEKRRLNEKLVESWCVCVCVTQAGVGGSNNSSNSSSSTGTGSQGYSSSTSAGGGGVGGGGGGSVGGANSSPATATGTNTTTTTSTGSSNNSDQLSRTNLYIRGLTPNTTDKDLEELCRKYIHKSYYFHIIKIQFCLGYWLIDWIVLFFLDSAPSFRPKPFSIRIPTSAKATVSSISIRHRRPNRPSKPCSFKAFKRRWRR